MFNLINTLSEKPLRRLSLILVFFTQVVMAEQIKLTTTLNIGAGLIEKKIDQTVLENSKIQKSITGLKYESQFPITIDQINLNTELSMSVTKKTQNMNIFETTMPEIKVSGEILNLHLSGLIEKEVAGAKIKIKVESDCKNILFLVKSSENIFMNELVDNSGENLIKSQFSYKNLAFEFQPFQCSQIHGIEDVILKNITDALSQQLPIQQLISDQIGLVLTDKVKNYKSDAIKKLNQMVQSINPDIEVTVQKTTTADKTSVDVNKVDFEKAIQQALSKKINKYVYTSDDIPELKKLLASRFKQFFIWPALMQRPKNKALQLQPVLESFSFNLPTDQLTTAIDLNLVLGQWVQDQSIPMVYFRSVADFNKATQASVQLSKLSNNYIWDKSYVLKNKVSERISLNLVNASLQKLVQDKITTEMFSRQNSFLKYINSFYLHNGILQIHLE